MPRGEDDESWTYLPALKMWNCNVCGAQVSKRWKNQHETTDGCLSVLIPEYTKVVLQKRASKFSDLDTEDFENFDQIAEEDCCYTANLSIDMEGRNSWTSDSFEVNGHSWALQAVYGRNCINLCLVWLQREDHDYRMSLGLRFKFGDRDYGDWEFIDVLTNKARTHTWTVDVDTTDFRLQMKVFSSDPLPKEVQNELSKHDLEFLAKYDNFHTRSLFEWMSQHSIPRGVSDALFKVLHAPGFDIKQTPSSTHLMEKIETQFYSRFTKKTLEFEKDGKIWKLTYNDPESILDHVLASDIYTEGWVQRSNHDIDHPSGWDGWLEYEKEHKSLLLQNHQLVLGTVWMDKYVAEESRQHSVCSVILSFANFSKKVLHTQSSRFLVCTIPGHLLEFQNEIIRKTIIEFFAKLENATLGRKKFPFTNEAVPVCGGLFAVKGDHMEKTHIAGIVGPSGNVPSFYTKTKKEDITNLAKKKTFRDPLFTRVVLSKIRSKTTKADKADITRVTGITERESPFWELRIFARHFYLRFGICSLHLLHLGVTKKYTEEIGVAMKKQYMTEINKRIKQSPPPQPDMTRITMPIYNKKYDGTVALTGRMWSTWTATSTSINTGLLKDTALERWSFVMEGLRTIDETTWTREQLKDDGELDQLVRDIVRNILNSFEGLGDDAPDWNIPNIETLFALSRSIRFLGPLWFQSTDMEEGTNKLHRGCIRVTNHKMIANQMLKEVDRRRAIEMAKFKNDEEKNSYLRFKQSFVKPKKEREFFAGLHPVDKEMSVGDVNIIQKQLDLLGTENVSYRVKGLTRTYFKSVFYHKRKIEIENKPMLRY